MATPPPLYGHLINWPPPSRPDADHVWVVDWGNEKVVEVESEPHLLIPLKKRYTDPYGFRDKIIQEPLRNDGCPLCHLITVSQAYLGLNSVHNTRSGSLLPRHSLSL